MQRGLHNRPCIASTSVNVQDRHSAACMVCTDSTLLPTLRYVPPAHEVRCISVLMTHHNVNVANVSLHTLCHLTDGELACTCIALVAGNLHSSTTHQRTGQGGTKLNASLHCVNITAHVPTSTRPLQHHATATPRLPTPLHLHCIPMPILGPLLLAHTQEYNPENPNLDCNPNCCHLLGPALLHPPLLAHPLVCQRQHPWGRCV